MNTMNIRSVLRGAWVTPLLLITMTAHAGGDAIPLQKIGLHALNLVILIGVVGFLTRNMIRDGLANRAARVREAIEASDRAQAEARERFAELEQRMAGLESQLADMRKEAEADGARERDLLLAKASSEAESIRAGVARAVRSETEQARVALRAHVAELAVRLASEQAAASITDADHVRLTRDFLGTVSSATEVSHG